MAFAWNPFDVNIYPYPSFSMWFACLVAEPVKADDAEMDCSTQPINDKNEGKIIH